MEAFPILCIQLLNLGCDPGSIPWYFSRFLLRLVADTEKCHMLSRDVTILIFL